MNKLIWSFLFVVSCHASAVDYYMVTNDYVRVRDKPNLQGRSLVMLNKGHLVIKLGEEGEWSKIYFLGREEVNGRTEGWMSSQFLAPENSVVNSTLKEELILADKGAALSCEKVIGNEFIQGCDLQLEYALVKGVGLKNIKVNCSAELVAKTLKGDLIPVPVSQTLDYVVSSPDERFSMNILMKADLSYQLTEVNLEGHRCRVVESL
ncbi:SH3 domain-containing protein [Neptuniibacter marinus]|uniref:SH3 domain-containing protein n=1 Tax=Neptuniibacter marinus TaxID=1806670 RepID=UPI003B591A0B